MGALDHRTIRTAYAFNNPLSLHRHTSPKSITSLLSSITLHGLPSLILDTIKRGEDDEDVSRGELTKRAGKSVIVRIYESLGGKSRGTIKTGGLEVRKVTRCNLLEDDGEEVKIHEGEVRIELRAFEVATFRLWL